MLAMFVNKGTKTDSLRGFMMGNVYILSSLEIHRVIFLSIRGQSHIHVSDLLQRDLMNTIKVRC